MNLSSLNLPTKQDVDAARAGKPIPKGPTRLQQAEAKRPLVKVDASLSAGKCITSTAAGRICASRTAARSFSA